MDVMILSIAVVLLAVQSFVQSLVQAKLNKRVKDLELGVIKVASVINQIVELQGMMINNKKAGWK